MMRSTNYYRNSVKLTCLKRSRKSISDESGEPQVESEQGAGIGNRSGEMVLLQNTAIEVNGFKQIRPNDARFHEKRQRFRQRAGS
jgi:SOS-response transcriptional repressor LexA